jgi:hypothetical protein
MDGRWVGTIVLQQIVEQVAIVRGVRSRHTFNFHRKAILEQPICVARVGILFEMSYPHAQTGDFACAGGVGFAHEITSSYKHEMEPFHLLVSLLWSSRSGGKFIKDRDVLSSILRRVR